MKKIFVFLAAFWLISVSAFAVEWDDFAYFENGIKVVDIHAYNAAVAEEKVAAAGLDLDIGSFWILNDVYDVVFDNDAFELAYAAALASQKVSIDDVPNEDPVVEPPAVDDPPVVSGDASDNTGDEDPTDNFLLDPSAASSLDPVVGSPTEDPVLDVGGVSGVIEENIVPHVYAVSDQRSFATYSLDIVSGLKALVVSIFGEYTPVMTTIAVTETVDNVTTTTLVDAVASGAAGVDYVWLSGVALFAIILFCALKLLGGVLK